MVWGRVVKAANTPCHPLPPSGAPLAGAGAVPPGALVPPCIWWRLFNCQCIVYILGCCHSSTQQQPLDTKNGRHQEGIQTSWRTRHLELVGMGQSVHGHGGVGSLSPEAPSARKLSYRAITLSFLVAPGLAWSTRVALPWQGWPHHARAPPCGQIQAPLAPGLFKLEGPFQPDLPNHLAALR